MSLHPAIAQAFKDRRVLKVITGLNNFNVKEIILKVQAAEIGRATYIDIAANTEIIQEVKRITSIPICVSSIHIDELCRSFEAGADILEIGNFDIFYEKNIYFTKKQIEDLTMELISRIPNASICVTIPHYLSLNKQIELAKKLETLGVDIIQTEGISSKVNSNNYLLNSIYNASASLSSTYVFSQHVNIPILSSSGINALTAPIAIAYGASGVGIGSFFNSSNNIFNLASTIYSIMASMNCSKPIDCQLKNYLLCYRKYYSYNINPTDKKILDLYYSIH